MKISKYPDGSSYATIPEEWWGQTLDITFRFNNYEEFRHLRQLCEVLEHRNCTNTVITIPNFLGAQADRRFNENESSDLYQMVSDLNSYESIHFNLFHPHNPDVMEALFDRLTIIDNSKFIEHVLSLIKKDRSDNGFWDSYWPETNLILCSSDAGGFKPLMKLCDKIGWRGKTASCSKYRHWDGEKSVLMQQAPSDDFYGKDILIVDDICVYGGTFVGLARLLKEKNVGKLYLAVSHMTVPNPNPELFSLYDKVFTTDSKGFEYYIPDDKGARCPISNLEIVKLFN